MAEGLVKAGHRVIGCGRTAEAIGHLRAALGHPHDFAELDVTHDLAVKAWADRVIAEHGPPDLLINNAALINRNAPLWAVPAAEFDHVIDVNIKGVVNVIRHFAPAMIARGSGVIANLSSGWGRSTAPEVAPYCATKWAIEGLTRAGPGAPQGPGRRPGESRHHRHRDAQELLRRVVVGVSRPRGMGEVGRAVLPRAGPQGQRPAADGAGAMMQARKCRILETRSRRGSTGPVKAILSSNGPR